MPGETLAFQIVVASGAHGLASVRLELSGLWRQLPIPPRNIQPYLVYEVPMARRSGGARAGESLGWERRAEPPSLRPPTSVPDALIPLGHAPAWAAYPARIPAGSMTSFWVDIRLPEAGLAGGNYSANVEVFEARQLLASIPVRLRVGSTVLPYAGVNTMLYFEPTEVSERVSSADAVDQYLQLLHAHHITSVFPLSSQAELESANAYLSGELFTKNHGYDGPGQGLRPSVVPLGAYGSLGDPLPETLAKVDSLLAGLERLGLRDRPGLSDIFLYAIDEQCRSPRGAAWRQALSSSSSPRLRALRVGQTCDEPPEKQLVDLVMMPGGSYRLDTAGRARRAAKHVWIYNGILPNTGAFLTDVPTLSLRANPWIQKFYGIERWFYWESTFWNDSNRGGLGPYDPFATSETFHNQDGDHCNGDGLLVYPGRQAKFPEHDLGFSGVLPSIRLKQWRRGIQDAAYIELARRVDPAAVERVVGTVVSGALGASVYAKYVEDPERFRRARRELFELIEHGKD